MRNTLFVSVARTALTALALIVSLNAHAVDGNSTNAQDPAASLLDQLFSPPAPLRDSGSATLAEEIIERTPHLFSLAGTDSTGKQWQFSLDAIANAEKPTFQLNGLQQLSPVLPDHLTVAPGQLAQSLTSEGLNPQLGQWIASAARYAGNMQISASMPLEASFVSQAPAETMTAALNSREVTQHLEKHGESVSLLAHLLGWQKTGLLPSAADLQQMASSHVSAVTASVERWALQNVSFSSSLAITDNDTQGQMLQWQWSATNTHQYNTNSVADNEANFSANLRRLFGMHDYYQ